MTLSNAFMTSPVSGLILCPLLYWENYAPMREHLCSATGLLKPLWTPEQPGYIAEHVQCSDGSHLTPHLNFANYFIKNQNMQVVLQEQPTAGHSAGAGSRLSLGLSAREPGEWAFLAPCPTGVKDPLCHLQSFIVQTLVQHLCPA